MGAFGDKRDASHWHAGRLYKYVGVLEVDAQPSSGCEVLRLCD